MRTALTNKSPLHGHHPQLVHELCLTALGQRQRSAFALVDVRAQRAWESPRRAVQRGT